MTTRKRFRIAVWIVLVAIAGLGGVSYLHSYHTRISWSDSRLIVVSISDGNLRIVHLTAELNATYVHYSPLEAVADHWTDVPTKAITLHRDNQISFMDTTISCLAVGCSLIAPLAIVLAFFLVVRVVKRRHLFASTVREIIRPSDRQMIRPIRRVFRRSVVVILGLGTILAVATWAVSYTGLSLAETYSKQFDQGTLTVYSPFYRCQILVSFGKRAFLDSNLSIRADKGRVDVRYR
ncbi:MAG: hypothetical protein IH987_06320, partial [Planctomycetes bacterium]|nr:hypothetical protein [Planctomycetota bacterium]